jgi:hypothetical protein
MTLRKRLRVMWAAMRQDWHQHVCACGRTQWIEGRDTWGDPSMCVSCEGQHFDQWLQDYKARRRHTEVA